MIVSTEMENGTKFSYDNAKFSMEPPSLTITKPFDGIHGAEVVLNTIEIMKLLGFIINHLIKI